MENLITVVVAVDYSVGAVSWRIAGPVDGEFARWRGDLVSQGPAALNEITRACEHAIQTLLNRLDDAWYRPEPWR